MIAPTFSLTIAKRKVDPAIRKSVLRLACELHTTLASEIMLLIYDRDYRIIDADTFPVGADLEVAIGFGSTLHPVMLGEIVSLEPQLRDDGLPLLIVRAYDKSHRLRQQQPARPPFLHVRDSQIASQIAGEAGLRDEVQQTPAVHEYLQQTGSDWRFLRQRARANGFDLRVDFDTLYFAPPAGSRQTHTLKRGVNLLELRLRLSTATQPGVHVVRGWDGKQKQPMVAKATPETFAGEVAGDRLGAAVAAGVFGLARSLTMDSPIASQDEAERLAQAEFNQRARDFIRGEAVCPGIAEMKTGDLVELRGIGRRFAGRYRITRTTHIIDDKGFRTHASFERNGL